MKIRTAEQYRRVLDRRDGQAARARRTRFSDWSGVTASHSMVVGWAGIPGECGAECACGVTYDGFDRLAEAVELLDRHIAARRGLKPDHAARAVDIAECFPPLGLSLTGPRTPHPGGKPSTHATPLDWDQRADRYLAQSGRITPAQSRRLRSKERRALKRI